MPKGLSSYQGGTHMNAMHKKMTRRMMTEGEMPAHKRKKSRKNKTY